MPSTPTLWQKVLKWGGMMLEMDPMTASFGIAMTLYGTKSRYASGALTKQQAIRSTVGDVFMGVLAFNHGIGMAGKAARTVKGDAEEMGATREATRGTNKALIQARKLDIESRNAQYMREAETRTSQPGYNERLAEMNRFAFEKPPDIDTLRESEYVRLKTEYNRGGITLEQDAEGEKTRKQLLAGFRNDFRIHSATGRNNLDAFMSECGVKPISRYSEEMAKQEYDEMSLAKSSASRENEVFAHETKSAIEDMRIQKPSLYSYPGQSKGYGFSVQLKTFMRGRSLDDFDVGEYIRYLDRQPYTRDEEFFRMNAMRYVQE